MAEVVVDDIDGDRADDVVAVERSTGKLWLYAGAGRVEIGSGGWNGMHDLATGDFNGDTKADLVAVDTSTTGQAASGRRPAAASDGAPAYRAGEPRMWPISWNGTANMSCRTNARRSLGASESSTTTRARPTESASATSSSGAGSSSG
ncbi:FG-GAP-like repeat-containing protein, partial [Streptomyces massasporeus]